MRIRLRSLAATDIDSALAYYRDEAGQAIALKFVSDLEATFNQIEHHLLVGSLRFAFELEIPGLGSLGLSRFPYLVFYMVNETSIEVWRELHAKRDIPAFLREGQ